MCARVCSGTSAGYYHPEMLVNIHFFKKKLGLCIHLLEWKNFWYKKTKGRELLFWSGCSKIILSQEIPTSIF